MACPSLIFVMAASATQGMQDMQGELLRGRHIVIGYSLRRERHFPVTMNERRNPRIPVTENSGVRLSAHEVGQGTFSPTVWINLFMYLSLDCLYYICTTDLAFFFKLLFLHLRDTREKFFF